MKIVIEFYVESMGFSNYNYLSSSAHDEEDMGMFY